MTIQAHITVAVIDDRYEAKTLQPVGEGHSAVADDAYRCTKLCFDQYAIPFQVAVVFWLAEFIDEAAFSRPG